MDLMSKYLGIMKYNKDLPSDIATDANTPVGAIHNSLTCQHKMVPTVDRTNNEKVSSANIPDKTDKILLDHTGKSIEVSGESFVVTPLDEAPPLSPPVFPGFEEPTHPPPLGAPPTNMDASLIAPEKGSSWPPEIQLLINWFLKLDPGSIAPFYLEPHRREDPVKFFRSLRRDIAAGPTGPRAKDGALQEDLRKLKNILN